MAPHCGGSYLEVCCLQGVVAGHADRSLKIAWCGESATKTTVAIAAMTPLPRAGWYNVDVGGASKKDGVVAIKWWTRGPAGVSSASGGCQGAMASAQDGKAARGWACHDDLDEKGLAGGDGVGRRHAVQY